MTTQRKIRANRANARASTGPRTALGKSRSARNARQHGLGISIFADPTRSAELSDLAREIAGEEAGPDVIEHARRVAEAHIEVLRARQARHDLVSAFLDSKPGAGSPGDVVKKAAAMDRYERRALSRRKFAIRELDEARQEDSGAT